MEKQKEAGDALSVGVLHLRPSLQGGHPDIPKSAFALPAQHALANKKARLAKRFEE